MANGQKVRCSGLWRKPSLQDQVNIGPLPANLLSGVITMTLMFHGVTTSDVSVRLQ